MVLGLAWATLHFWIVPRIAEFRPALESLARESLGVAVRIGGVSAQSTGWVPSFVLRDIELQDTQGFTALRLPKVVVALSLRSAAALQLDQLVLDAPELDVRLTPDGQWLLAGIPWQNTSSGDSAALDWLLSQREIVVRGARIHWHGPSTATGQNAQAPTPMTLREVDLVIRNSARQHALRLDATPPPGWGDRWVLMGEFKRGLLSLRPGRLADWSGQLFAHLPNLDLALWSTTPQPPLPVAWAALANSLSGQARLRLWAGVHQGQWRDGLLDAELLNLRASLRPDGPPWALNSLSTRMAMQVHAEGIAVQTQGLMLTREQGQTWHTGPLSLAYTHAQGARPAQGQLRAQQLSLQALQSLAVHMPNETWPSPPWRSALQARTLNGHITSMNLRWQGEGHEAQLQEAQVAAQGLSWEPKPSNIAVEVPSAVTHWPGLRGVNIELDLQPTGGHMDLRGGAGSALWLPGVLLPAEVPLDQLQASARWERQGPSGPNANTWHVPQWQVALRNADLDGQWQGQWRPSDDGDGPGVLNLNGQIVRARAAAAHRYLPVALPESVRHYLRDALIEGHYENVQMQVQGDLRRLPFARPQDGLFRFSGQIKDAIFDIVPASLRSPTDPVWPRLQALQGQLTFDRLGMQLKDVSTRVGDGAQAVWLKAPVLEIADMREQPVLRVQAHSDAQAQQVLSLVRHSPLSPMLSGVLDHAQASGPLLTRIDLRLPLLDLRKTQVQGSVQLQGTDLRMMPGTPWLKNLMGSLQFRDTGFEVHQLQATLLGGPVRIDGGMYPPAPSETRHPPLPTIMLQAQGRVSAEGLQAAQEIKPLNLLARHASGSTPYRAHLAWKQGLPQWSVHSDLEGLSLNLPAPLGKTAHSTRALAVQIHSRQAATGLQDNIQISLGDTAQLVYVRDLANATPRVLRGSLGLGVSQAQMPALPEHGVIAQLALDHLVVDDWLALLPDPPNTHTDAGHAEWASYLPTHMGLQANTLRWGEREWHQVRAGGTRDTTQWQANIDAQELSGHVTFRPAQQDQTGQLYARLSRLRLPPSSAHQVETWLQAPPTQLPALDIVVQALELRGIKLGRVEIEAVNTETQRSLSPAAPEWQLKKFNLYSPEATLQSSGRWLAAREGNPLSKTEMSFVLDVRDAGGLLTRLGTPNALRAGRGHLEGAVSWQGSPLGLHYPSMNGHFELQMGRGQFLKADAGAAKLLGVLSLQALPRRLLLDFRDVFAQGFAFDSVQGDVTIVHGMANTRNLLIQGVNAQVLLEGSADLANETQNLRVGIWPVVDTGTASLLAGLTVNPMVGLTTFLAQWLLQNPLSRASAQAFTVDGNWAEPRVTRMAPPTDSLLRPSP